MPHLRYQLHKARRLGNEQNGEGDNADGDEEGLHFLGGLTCLLGSSAGKRHRFFSLVCVFFVYF